ncbi:peptidoglycan DD-metalloendopeptidase family protein [Halomonas sp. MCCC 1A17488]|uniref:peptidoglycan DD-metalloendopeptidase family protein n=1 Tax=unclassified Halomonas TaxID=2609666 RepID=UPI0018D261F2|nr:MULTISPECIES: peptidoglycan DD-metalloendopeptidase family protein [unclassified Halomonas]MCE8016091.1 peptidoglycan DD-metalloendopeptidase family protein [Halomonas sp. MCCC 1A17488]MCG3239424.1 peptidoglycan DD-metalloendopeptidase family protein [Halomonas sp. MCCC 1A17488]QPP50647.1 peptidoglycan DD-metalloendopeptidase family protein [Halomonas sp. SS10-MC5]
MLRILHSLPRTHKLLLLPVATMVTVLGAQKIVTLVENTQREGQVPETVLFPLSPEAQPGLPALNSERYSVADAIEIATQAIDASRDYIPLSQLQPSEIVDLSGVAVARAQPQAAPAAAELDAATAGLPGDTGGIELATELDSGALHMAMVIGTLASGMLDDMHTDDEALAADATSYEDYPDEELALFEEGPIHFDHEVAATEPHVPEWRTYTVQQGDTFAVLAQNELGLGYSEAMRLLEDMPDQRLLTHWRVGNTFEYQLDEQERLLALRIMKNAREGFMLERDEDGFDVATIERAGEATQRLFAGSVSGSFARSAQATGLSSTEVAQISRLLEKKLDFRRDTRRGDEFQVLIESDIIDGSSFDSRVLAIEYQGARMNLTLVRNSDDNNFYTPDGQSLDPAFSRYPFEGSYRMSSSFNPRRTHPVTGRVSPHRGTDWAMPIGTPVTAPADGRVEKVGNHPMAGRYIVVRHDNGYRTRYLHLSRALVNRGDRVSMGERIALSGNTGRSTGPHLHYEVIVDNNAVDAMKVELPESQSLDGERLVAFQREAEPLLAALRSGQTGPVVAQADTEEDDD